MAEALAEPALSNVQGESAGWDDDELIALALLLLSDAERAAARWDRLAPKPYRGLLNAKPYDTRAAAMAANVRGFWFDRHQQRYGYANRGYVAATGIRGAVLQAVTNAQLQAERLVMPVLAGVLSVGQWQTLFADALKLQRLALYAAGQGGVSLLDTEDMRLVSDGLAFQYERLERFAGAVAERDVGTVDAVVRRAAAYAKANGLPAWEQGRHEGHEAAGFDEERRVMSPAEHCPDCPGLAAQGWVPIGTLPLIGEGTACSFQCHCSFEFRRSEDEPDDE